MSVRFQLRLELVWKNYFIPFNCPSLSVIITLLWPQHALICAKQHTQYYLEKNQQISGVPFILLDISVTFLSVTFLSIQIHYHLLQLWMCLVRDHLAAGEMQSCPGLGTALEPLEETSSPNWDSAKDAGGICRGWASLHKKGKCQDSCIYKPPITNRVREHKRHSHAATTTCLHQDLLAQRYLHICYIGESCTMPSRVTRSCQIATWLARNLFLPSSDLYLLQ